jgi:hypothetical protein
MLPVPEVMIQLSLEELLDPALVQPGQESLEILPVFELLQKVAVQ